MDNFQLRRGQIVKIRFDDVLSHFIVFNSHNIRFFDPNVCCWTLGGNNILYSSQVYQNDSSIAFYGTLKYADISILDKSVIFRLPFCVFPWHSVPIYANGSLTYWLPDRIKTISWLWKAFHNWVCQLLLEMHKK